jgi:hypothetical protein
MFRLIVALLLILGGFSVHIHASEPYKPLTIQEAVTYVQTLTQDQLAAQIVKLDRIEHEVPIVEFPAMIAGTTVDGKVWISWADPGKLKLSIADGALLYDLELPKQVFEGLAKPPDSLAVFFAIGTAALVASTGTMIGSEKPVLAIPISSLLAIGSGWMIYELTR